MFFLPEMGGYFLESNNFIPADPLKTPLEIAPVWYFTPYYAILRAIPPVLNSQFPGVLVMGFSVLVFFALPWLDRGNVKSIRYRGPRWKIAFGAFLVSFCILAYFGVHPTNVWGAFPKGWPLVGGDYIAVWAARVLTIVYFFFFLAMPWYTARDRAQEKPEPLRVTW
jgi:ubiquinol-cytochrome c reductase cytochrome b subunit